ncbi:hypothetical protein FJQ98_16250 [Lysinibacillus agricola]|uniref:Uncharacterized protein n=1 Tax=Lysinibacillus agricola TaxID=2590012 RepID=A0ABX7ALM1_9BACI|nr:MULTISPECIES: hypothetical protein [Lysinibacillus]KOS61511.1 hypothetical protein AN161_18145 [Lysinibacillus sp. FJAT-14222]QQP10797.1 hypothetical protein FJQ98_16250 [Lysinibacillus agricola]
MIEIKEGFGVDNKVWAFTFSKPYQIVPIGENKLGENHLNRRLKKLKEYDTPKYLGNVGSLLPHRYSNIKEIKKEIILVKKFISRKGTDDEEIYYDKEFEVFVIHFDDNENLMVLNKN